ncbi:DUF4296 domain-containing protein [uncultured Flavobacterium sp.]|uniref:DUF4296 domain-containing protein n=1 Tax=uncultured Flavobacterium sp. TaxID=165435 RepID=UPI0025DD6507|nr:DUF4296 domain-containing protein [uncultured Flavobacterium sp.]
MKKLTYILLSLLVVACAKQDAEKPENLLPEGKMVDILYDINILQAINSYTPQVLDSNKVEPKNYIYKKYSTDSLIFTQSHNYYAADLERYEEIQKKVADRVEKDKVKYGIKKKQEAAKPAVKNESSGPKIRPRTRTVRTSDTAG